MVCRDDRYPPLAVGEQTTESIMGMDYIWPIITDNPPEVLKVREIPRYPFFVNSEEMALDSLPLHGLNLLRDEWSITSLLAACDDEDFHFRIDRGCRV